MTWSEFFLKVSIKRTCSSQKKSIVLFYLLTGLLSLLNVLVWIFGKSLYQTTSTIFFSNSGSLEQPGLIIKTFEQYLVELKPETSIVLKLKHIRTFIFVVWWKVRFFLNNPNKLTRINSYIHKTRLFIIILWMCFINQSKQLLEKFI